MNNIEIREPKQKRSIIKKEKIIDVGWKLISKNGYHNTNTAEIAKEANVSTGIIYQYFKDKHDILIAGLDKYGNDIFFPKINKNIKLTNYNITNTFKEIITEYINDHKVSQEAHEEIMAMVHIDDEVAKYYYEREMSLTYELADMLDSAGFKTNDLKEKTHIIVGLIDNLCHEIIFHKHNELEYENMTNIIVKNIEYIIKNDFE